MILGFGRFEFAESRVPVLLMTMMQNGVMILSMTSESLNFGKKRGGEKILGGGR